MNPNARLLDSPSGQWWRMWASADHVDGLTAVGQLTENVGPSAMLVGAWALGRASSAVSLECL